MREIRLIDVIHTFYQERSYDKIREKKSSIVKHNSLSTT